MATKQFYELHYTKDDVIYKMTSLVDTNIIKPIQCGDIYNMIY